MKSCACGLQLLWLLCLLPACSCGNTFAQVYAPIAADSAQGTDTRETPAAEEPDPLTGLRTDDFILIRFTTIQGTQANLYFPMDGSGPPEFTVFLSLHALYEDQALNSNTVPMIRMPLREIKTGAGFTSMDASREIRVPVSLIAKQLDACRQKYGEPTDLQLELKLMEDDRYNDDAIVTYSYPLARGKQKKFEFSQRYVLMNLYVFVEGFVEVKRGSLASGPETASDDITTNFNPPTGEPDAPAVAGGFPAVACQALVWFLAAFATLYIALRWFDKISENLVTGVVQVGAVALVLTGANTGLSLFNLLVLGGGMFTGAFVPIQIIILLAILYRYYGFTATEFVFVIALNLFIQLCAYGIMETIRSFV